MWFATCNTWTLLLKYCTVRASLYTFATLDTLVVVDDRALANNADSILGADILTSVADTASAGGRYENTFCGALVAGDVDNLYNVGIALVTTAGHTHPLLKDCALFVDAATEFGFGAGGDLLGNVDVCTIECAVIGAADNLFEYIVFEELYAGIENFVLLHSFCKDKVRFLLNYIATKVIFFPCYAKYPSLI